MSTTDILNKARDLGEMISDSDEMKELVIAQENLAKDASAQTKLEEYKKLQESLQKAVTSRDLALADSYREKMKAMQDELNAVESVSNYTKANTELDKLIGNVNSVISFVISGEEGCSSGGCSGCSGCGG
jgi:cell fate (sporulation/competence/biofilm development) regulator YlbF (YheA/YmcA/DUF963 family)